MVTDNLTELITVTQAGGGMEIGNWITLSAVLVALGLGVSSLIQTQMLQKKDRKERLLTEIIEWAMDVAKCGFSVNIQEPPPIFTGLSSNTYTAEQKKRIEKGILADDQRTWRSRFMRLHFNYQALEVKGEYILSLGKIETLKNINTNMTIVKAQLHDVLDVMWSYLEDFDNESKREELNKKEKELQESAVSLIKEAAKINARDMGIEELQEVRNMAELDVGKQLAEIREMLQKNERKANIQWVYTLGFAAMIGSVTLLGLDTGAAFIVFVLGLGLMILSPYIKK